MQDSFGARGSFDRFMEVLRHPLFIVFHVVALAAAVYHTCTWFNVTPKVLVVRIGEHRVPGTLIAAGHYFLWLPVSAVTRGAPWTGGRGTRRAVRTPWGAVEEVDARTS